MTLAEKLTRVAENTERVFDAGRAAQRDAFWETYQQNGNRTDYNQGFAGVGWTREMIKPKYDIYVTSAFEMFRGQPGLDLTEIGVEVDFSRCTTLSNTFYGSGVTHIGVLDATASSQVSHTFYNAKSLKTIDLMKVAKNNVFLNAFNNCDELESIILEGTIANDFDIHWSKKLSYASLESIYWAAYNGYQLGASFTLTLPKTAVESAYSPDQWQTNVDHIDIDIVLA